MSLTPACSFLGNRLKWYGTETIEVQIKQMRVFKFPVLYEYQYNSWTGTAPVASGKPSHGAR